MNVSENEINDTLKETANQESYSKNISNLQAECILHMMENGIPFQGSLNLDGRIHRFSVDEKKKKRDEWYIAFEGKSKRGNCYLNCIYGSWSTGDKYAYQSWNENDVLNEQDLQELRKAAQDAKQLAEDRLKEQHEKAALESQAIWDSCKNSKPNENHLLYLKLKKVKPYGLRYGNNEYDHASIIIPLHNNEGVIRSVQYISVGNDGTIYKSFHTGGEKKGNYYIIGSIINGQPFYISEGFATGASPYEANGKPTVVAFDSGNLAPVIKNLRKIYPNSKITILADDDKETKNNKGEFINPGKSAAEKASRQYGCDFILPEFPNDIRLPNGKCPTDFNDLHVLFGLDQVKRQLEALRTSYDWPEPKPITASLYPVPSFDSKTLLPEALHDWIMDEADRMPCPPDFIAAPALISLGIVIGARCAIKPKCFDNWQVVPNMWGGCVGVPTSKKSPATTAGMKLLNRLIAKAVEVHREALGDHEIDKIVFETKKASVEAALKAAIKESKKNDVEKMSEKLKNHLKEAKEPPSQRRYKSNDTTIQKLGELLKQNPAGILVLRDELVGLLASWDSAGHEGDRAFFLEAWNGDADFNTDRIGRGEIFIPNLCVAIYGGIQPDKLTRYLEQAANALGNDGMLQRFQILVYPDEQNWEWRDRAPNKNAFERASTIFHLLANFNPVEWGAEPNDAYAKFPYFRFSEQAQEIFIKWTTELHKVRLPAVDNQLIAQHLAKFDKLFPSLALIFHLVDCAATGKRGPVSAESAWRAAAWCEYLEAHAQRCYGLLADDGLRSAQALSNKVRKAKLSDGFTARDVRRNQWRYLTTDLAVQSALDWLEDEGWLRSNEVGGAGPGSGRRTSRYSINPKIKKMEKPEDENDELA